MTYTEYNTPGDFYTLHFSLSLVCEHRLTYVLPETAQNSSQLLRETTVGYSSRSGERFQSPLRHAGLELRRATAPLPLTCGVRDDMETLCALPVYQRIRE